MAEHSGASYSQLWFKMGVPLRNNFQENFISEDPRESLGNYSLYNAIFCGSYPHYLAPQYLIVQTALKSFGQLFIHFSNILSIVARLEFQRLCENLLQYILLFLAMPQKKYHKKLIFFLFFFSFFDKLSIIEQAVTIQYYTSLYTQVVDIAGIQLSLYIFIEKYVYITVHSKICQKVQFRATKNL